MTNLLCIIFTRDLGLHKLVFMNGILPEGTEVGYYVRGKVVLVDNDSYSSLKISNNVCLIDTSFAEIT